MSDSKPVEPKRWNEDEAAPPCTVSYSFTLLDISNNLRFCCHGDKVHSKFESLKTQWTDKTYTEFRKQWSENYKEQKGLCLGCPHHEENKWSGDIVAKYLAENPEE